MPTQAPTSAPAPAPAPVATPTVTHQVFAEVERLVSTGPQSRPTQHLTLKLAPEALGEVRVTLSMRGDSVHVRLTAGSEQARHALSEGSPELQQLLETHAGDVRVTVRDVPAPVAAVSAPTAAQLVAQHGTQLDLGQAPSHQTSGGPHPMRPVATEDGRH